MITAGCQIITSDLSVQMEAIRRVNRCPIEGDILGGVDPYDTNK
jgi:hypothetical protein